MNQLSNCTFWKILSGIFFILVLASTLYCGLKLGYWMGFGTLVLGFISGFIYAKFRKSKCGISDLRSR